MFLYFIYRDEWNTCSYSCFIDLDCVISNFLNTSPNTWDIFSSLSCWDERQTCYYASLNCTGTISFFKNPYKLFRTPVDLFLSLTPFWWMEMLLFFLFLPRWPHSQWRILLRLEEWGREGKVLGHDPYPFLSQQVLTSTFVPYHAAANPNLVTDCHKRL